MGSNVADSSAFLPRGIVRIVYKSHSEVFSPIGRGVHTGLPKRGQTIGGTLSASDVPCKCPWRYVTC
jgi:hypothetical protein